MLVHTYLKEEGAQIRLEKLTNAAWHFAHHLLWDNRPMPESEKDYAKEQIVAWLKSDNELKAAFVAFCERVVLAQKYHAANPERKICQPSYWFNPLNSQGFRMTRHWLKDVHEKRKAEPMYLRHIAVMAYYFYRYSLSPCKYNFNCCRRKLRRLKAHRLFQQFKAVTLHRRTAA